MSPSVSSRGNGRRVQSRRPLLASALAGIPIFFITTYYSDFILVPHKDGRALSGHFLLGLRVLRERVVFRVARTITHPRRSRGVQRVSVDPRLRPTWPSCRPAHLTC